MFRHFRSRTGLVFCVAASLTFSGCAAGGWNRLVGKKTEEPSPKLTLAWSKLKEDEGRLTEARNGYESVLKKEPKNIDALLGVARLDEKAQRLVVAEEGYAKALELQPKSPYVLGEVGKFYALQQRWDKAIPLLQEAQRMEPHEKSHHFTLAMALTKAGKTDEALPHFTEAVGEAAAHYNIGRMLVESGKPAAAEQEFVLALAKDPNLSDAQYFLDEIRSNATNPAQPAPIVAQPKAPVPTTQRVSATSTSGRPTVTPANSSGPQVRPAARPPVYPHSGYEELPPPPDMMDGASTMAPQNRESASQIT
ncbi:MAG: cellulose synthase subunit BcsC, partial [Planctomycetaceae bacterium]|nr:cellulose synthase subunit BcsC [Planctomycetaceae bacterium]